MRHFPAHPNNSSRGASNVTVGVFIILLAAVVYLLSKLLPIYYSYYELKNQMASLIRVADENTDQEIRQKLAKQLKALDIPARIDEVRIRRSPRSMKIELSYRDWLVLWFGDYELELWEIDFIAQADGPIGPGTGR